METGGHDVECKRGEGTREPIKSHKARHSVTGWRTFVAAGFAWHKVSEKKKIVRKRTRMKTKSMQSHQYSCRQSMH